MTTAVLSLELYQAIVSRANLSELTFDSSVLENFELDFQPELNSYQIGSLTSIASTQLVWSGSGYTTTLSGSGISPVTSLSELEDALSDGLVTGALNQFVISQSGTTIADITYGPVAGDANRMLTLVSGSQELQFYGNIPPSFEGYIDFLELAVQVGSFSTMSTSEQNQLITDLQAYDLNGFAVIDDGETLFSFTADETTATLSVLGFELTVTGTFPDSLGVLLDMFNAAMQATAPITSLTFFDGIGDGLALDSVTFTDPNDAVFFSLTGPFVDETSFDEVDLTIDGGALADDINLFDLVGNDDSFNLVSSGSDGNDTLTGGSGADTLDGGADNDTIIGGAGNDVIYDGTGDDSVDGGDDDDTFHLGLGGGNDTIDGGSGNDTLVVDLSGLTPRSFTVFFDAVTEEGGAVEIATGRDTITSVENYTLIGDFNATIDGDAEDNHYVTDMGNDTIRGEVGNDTLDGGAGHDRLYGRADRDLLLGQDGDDRLFGGSARDTLFGGNDDDDLFGGKGRDRLEGGDGDDSLAGEGGKDNLLGNAGSDTLNGGAGNDKLTGGKNADTFVFEDGFGNDTIVDFSAANNAEDIDLSAVTAITDYADLLANHIDDSTGTVIIDDGAGNTITLQGITSIGQLDAGDFLF